jgi:hypothetical protein
MNNSKSTTYQPIKCPICLNEDIKTHTEYRIINPCQHEICEICFEEFKKHHLQCPLCKSNITSTIISLSNKQEDYNPSLLQSETINDEEFLLFSNEEFQNEVKVIESKLDLIQMNKFHLRNSSLSKYKSTFIDFDFYEQLLDEIDLIKLTIVHNTSSNHYDKNREILIKIMEVNEKVKRFEKGLTKEDVKEFETKSQDLYNIDIPKEFEKVRKKKSFKK